MGKRSKKRQRRPLLPRKMKTRRMKPSKCCSTCHVYLGRPVKKSHVKKRISQNVLPLTKNDKSQTSKRPRIVVTNNEDTTRTPRLEKSVEPKKLAVKIRDKKEAVQNLPKIINYYGSSTSVNESATQEEPIINIYSKMTFDTNLSTALKTNENSTTPVEKSVLQLNDCHVDLGRPVKIIDVKKRISQNVLPLTKNDKSQTSKRPRIVDTNDEDTTRTSRLEKSVEPKKLAVKIHDKKEAVQNLPMIINYYGSSTSVNESATQEEPIINIYSKMTFNTNLSTALKTNENSTILFEKSDLQLNDYKEPQPESVYNPTTSSNSENCQWSLPSTSTNDFSVRNHYFELNRLENVVNDTMNMIEELIGDEPEDQPESEPKPDTLNVESPTKDSDVIDITDSDDEDDVQLRTPRDLSSIVYLETKDEKRTLIIFPNYCPGIIEEMRAFFADENATLKPFATAEKYTCDAVLKILNEPKRWLNGSDIDTYFRLIENGSNGNVAVYKTFFTKINPPNDKSCRDLIEFNILSSMRRKSLFEKRFLLIPFNFLSMHWAFVCVDFLERSFCYCDSKYTSKTFKTNAYFYLICKHIIDEAMFHGIHLKVSDWNLYSCFPQVQKNNHDCGIFVCAFARSFVRGELTLLEERDVPLIRQRMVYELMRGELIS